MPPISPEQAKLLLLVALRSLRAEQAITRKVIEAIPAAECFYRLDEISKPAVDLAWHIVATEKRFFEAICSGKFEFTGGIRPEEMETPQMISDWYEEMYRTWRPRLEALTGEELVRIVDFRGMFQLPAVLFIDAVLSHSIHHRGQLSMYLRPMGARVPSIYGESHDSAEARRHAESTSA